MKKKSITFIAILLLFNFTGWAGTNQMKAFNKVDFQPVMKIGSGNLFADLHYEMGFLEADHPISQLSGYFDGYNGDFSVAYGDFLSLRKTSPNHGKQEKEFMPVETKKSDSGKLAKGIKNFNFGFKFGTAILSGFSTYSYKPLYLGGIDFFIWNKSNLGGGINLDIGYQKGESYLLTDTIKYSITFAHITGSFLYRIKKIKVIIPYFGLGISPTLFYQDSGSGNSYFGLGVQPLAGIMFKTVPFYIELKYLVTLIPFVKDNAYDKSVYGSFIVTAGLKF